MTSEPEVAATVTTREEHLRRMADALPALIAEIDADQCYRYTNVCHADWLGVAPAAAIGRTVGAVLDPRAYEVARPWIERAMRGEAVTFENTLTPPGGRRRHVLVNLVPRRAGADGRIDGVYGVAVDITERKRQEAALGRANELGLRFDERSRAIAETNERLRMSQRRLAAADNATFEFIGVLDPRGIILDVNRPSLDFAGLSREDVVGLPFWATPWWTGDEPRIEQLKAAIDRAAAGEFVRYKVDVRDASEARRTIDFSLQPARDHAGCIVLIIAEARDITQKRRAQETVRRSESRLNLALSAAEAGAWDWNLVTGETTWSSETYKLYGLDAAAGPPRFKSWRLTIHPDDRKATLRILLDAMKRSETTEFRTEFRVIHPTRDVRWLLALGRVERGPNGAARRLSGIHIDITERKRAEQELEAAKRTAERALAAKRRLLAALGHDLRQPLSVIRGVLELATERTAEDGLRLFLAKADRAAERLDRAFELLLEAARLDAGAMTPRVRDFDLGELLRDIEEQCGPAAEAKGLRLTIVPCTAVVRSDPDLLGAILHNLAGNAVKYTRHGRVLIGARRRGGRRLVVQVLDTGFGIPADKLGDIFQEYRRLDRTADEVSGVGLGLSIVQRTADLLGLPLRVRSAEGKGSCFEVEIPLASSTSRARGPNPIGREARR